MEKIKEIALAAALISFAILVGVDMSTTIPKEAPVLVNEELMTYRSSYCASNYEWREDVLVRRFVAENLGFKMDMACRDSGGFARDTKLLFYLLGSRPKWD